MDLSDVQNFLLPDDSVRKRVDQFIKDRIKDQRVNLHGGSMLFHVIPLGQDIRIVNWPSENSSIWQQFLPIRSSSGDYGYNLDGFYCFSPSREVPNSLGGITRVFRNGLLESITNDWDIKNGWEQHYKWTWAALNSAKKYVVAINQCVDVFPCALAVAIVKESSRQSGALYPTQSPDRTDIIIPFVVLETAPTDWYSALQDVVLTICHAFGVECSWYDAEGNWTGDDILKSA